MHIVNFLAKNLFKINGKYVSKKAISLKVSFCYGPRPWCPNSSKKWLNILFALAGQQNDDDVGTAEFHEKKNSWKWLSFLLFCIFNVFRRSIFYFENQFRNIGIWNHDRDILTRPQLPFFKKKKTTFFFTMRCKKTQFNPLLYCWYLVMLAIKRPQIVQNLYNFCTY